MSDEIIAPLINDRNYIESNDIKNEENESIINETTNLLDNNRENRNNNIIIIYYNPISNKLIIFFSYSIQLTLYTFFINYLSNNKIIYNIIDNNNILLYLSICIIPSIFYFIFKNQNMVTLNYFLILVSTIIIFFLFYKFAIIFSFKVILTIITITNITFLFNVLFILLNYEEKLIFLLSYIIIILLCIISIFVAKISIVNIILSIMPIYMIWLLTFGVEEKFEKDNITIMKYPLIHLSLHINFLFSLLIYLLCDFSYKKNRKNNLNNI